MPTNFWNLLEHSLSGLATERPVFHSEADFQFSLADAISKQSPGIQVRLEVPAASLGLKPVGRQTTDLVLRRDREVCLVELKYPKGKADVTIDDERFVLPQGPRDGARHGFLKDILRLEKCAHAYPGIALMLSNDRSLWTEQTIPRSDAQFQVHEGRCIEGRMELTEETAESTKRELPPIELSGRYRLGWRPYSTDPCEFRCVAALIPRSGAKSPE